MAVLFHWHVDCNIACRNRSNVKLKIMEDKAMLPTAKSYSSLPSFLEDVFGREFFPDFVEKPMLKSWTPSVNVVEDADSFRIELAAPGLSKEDFRIDLNQRILTISSEKSDEQMEEKSGKVLRREFSYSRFSRSFSLPVSVNVDKIGATCKDGVLTVVLPKKEESKETPARQIAIS